MSDTIHNPILGLYTKQAFGKSVHKGEDAWLQQPRLSWRPSGQVDGKIIPSSCSLQEPGWRSISRILMSYAHAGTKVDYGLYGVFDGHGGKQAANFASKHILPELQQQLAPVPESSDTKLSEALQDYKEQLPAEDMAAWQAQDVFAEALPQALVETFSQVQDKFHEHTKVQSLETIA